ncbi:MAG: histidine phosphatase family protein, partial [Bacteroidota bacterium]
MKQIYLIRHGETDYNKNKIVQGSGVDAALNATGLQQADQFFEVYQHIPFEEVYISQLQRTYQTVRRFIEEKNIPYQAFAGLNEISWGTREGMPFHPDEHQYYLDTIAAWQRGSIDLAIEGGESPRQVAERQKPIIARLKESSAKKLLVCMHGRAMRILLTQLLGYPLSYMDIFEHRNLT